MPPAAGLPSQDLTFTYHRKSADLRTFVYGIMLLIVMCEVPVFVLLLLFLKSPVGRGVVLAIIVAELLALVCILPSILFMRHGIKGNNLIIRFGILFKGIIPLGNIAAANAADGIRPRAMANFGVNYDRERNLLCITAGSKSEILLELNRPQRFRTFPFRSVLAFGVVMEADEPGRFLDALRQRLPAGSGNTVQSLPAGGESTMQVLPAAAGEEAAAPPAGDGPGAIPHGLAAPAIASAGTGAAGGRALEAQSLEKYYGSFKAVDRIDLQVRAGEICGFLGPNGAGKTTTMNMVTGLLRPSGGTIRVFGHDIWREPLAAKSLLAYVVDHPLVYDRLTGREFVRFSAQLYRMTGAGLEERIEQLLDGFELRDAADVLIRTYSQGMRRKVALAGAMVHCPGLLVLDEPTNGVDPRGTWVIKSLLRSLAEQGAAVLMSTHVLEVAENMCDRVVIIDKGRIVAEGTIGDLKEQSQMPGSSLEQIFLALTGPGNGREGVFAAR